MDNDKVQIVAERIEVTGVKMVLEMEGSGTKTSIFTGSKVFTPGKAGMSPFFFFLIPNYSLIHDFYPITMLNLYFLRLLLAFQLPNLIFILINPDFDLLVASTTAGRSRQLRIPSSF